MPTLARHRGARCSLTHGAWRLRSVRSASVYGSGVQGLVQHRPPTPIASVWVAVGSGFHDFRRYL
eukprot:scaffold31797_cov63-Phaeocystis_antarctica.AAC.4